MKKVLNLKLSKTNDDYTITKLNEIKWLLDNNEYNGYIKKINDIGIDSSLISNAKLYRYPKLNLPRVKIDSLKEKYNISITRNIDVADYKIVSDKYIESLVVDSWKYNAYEISHFINDLMPYLNLYEVDQDTINNFISNANKEGYFDSDLIVVMSTNLPYNDHFYKIINALKYSYKLLHDDFIEVYNSSNLITDKSLVSLISEDSVEITDEYFNTLSNMINSDNEENISIALEVIANSNYEMSFDKIAFLLYTNRDTLKHSKNWNTINVKTLRVYFSNYISYYGDKSNIAYYHNIINKLASDNRLTEFIFNKISNFMLENYINRVFNLNSKNSPFDFDVSMIKLKPEILKKIKKNHEVFTILFE